MKLLASLVFGGFLLLQGAESNISQPAYTVHEWGTFTSVAGKDGMALDWHPFGGPTDLPCFVHRFQIGYKASLTGKVRMETPVIYFYTPREMTARVRVSFPNGFITEWFPAATQVARGIGSGSNPNTGNVSRSGVREPKRGEPDSIEWPEVKLEPGAAVHYPFEFESSHYYAARSTDSTSLSAGGEREKFLFYRGVGGFQPPVAVEYVAGDQIKLRNLAKDPLPATIVFQNANGRVRYRSQGPLNAEFVAEIPKDDRTVESLQQEFVRILTEQGLFPREAQAMVETWRDSWFEEGTRVFYIVPAGEVDTILPLTAEPRPDHIARVFVGRVEVITPETRDAIKTALKRQDVGTLEKYGRFLQPLTGEFPASDLLGEILRKYLSLESACESGKKGW